MIALDSYQESLLGWPEGDARQRRAARVLTENNPNIDPADPGANGDWFKGMPRDRSRRFVPYNGGLGREQLRWLRGELKAAAAARERVIILSHDILNPEACDGTTMAFDFDKALEVIRESGAMVAMVLCGHDHKGGYHRDGHGVHHVTLCSPLNKGTDGSAYGMIEVHQDHIEFHGPALRDLVPPSAAAGVPAIHKGDASTAGIEVMRFPLMARGRR